MAFEIRKLGRQKLRFCSTNEDILLRYQLVIDGAKVTPTQARISISVPGGSSNPVVKNSRMDISGTIATYQLNTNDTSVWQVGTGYRADVTLTYAGNDYARHFIFDIAKFTFDLNMGFDQLVALDDSIEGMLHAGDDDFNALIVAVEDILQAKLESKVVRSGGLVDSMVLDVSRVATAARFLVLKQLFQNKRDIDTRDYYEQEFRDMWQAVLSTLKFDLAQDGEEGSELGGIQETRLVT